MGRPLLNMLMGDTCKFFTSLPSRVGASNRFMEPLGTWGRAAGNVGVVTDGGVTGGCVEG